ncbi:MAG: sigma-70 family RNA polymerase sigma factor [Terriglobales bacterium]
MGLGPPSEITRLLQSWQDGDQNALEQLTPLVYEELHRLARHYMAREKGGNILQTTALINEVYLRLVNAKLDLQGRAHFYAVCAQLMRRILTDFARSRGSQKRGGESKPVTLDEGLAVSPELSVDLIALDRALTRLEEADTRKGKVVELRFFGGLTVDETAVVLKISPDTVLRDWSMARAWLLREMAEGSHHEA